MKEYNILCMWGNFKNEFLRENPKGLVENSAQMIQQWRKLCLLCVQLRKKSKKERRKGIYGNELKTKSGKCKANLLFVAFNASTIWLNFIGHLEIFITYMLFNIQN